MPNNFKNDQNPQPNEPMDQSNSSTQPTTCPLPNYRRLLEETKHAASRFDFSADYRLTDEYRTNLVASNEKSKKWDIQTINEYSLVTKVRQSKRVEGTTSTMLLYAALAIPFLRCLHSYIEIWTQGRHAFENLDQLPENQKFSQVEKIIAEHFDATSTCIEAATKQMLDFVTDTHSWGKGKDINRSDVLMSPFCTALNLVQQSSTYLFDIAKFYMKNDALYQAACNALATADNLPQYMEGSKKTHLPQSLRGNILVYGAPGTGKSYHLEKQAIHDGKIVRRTVFHSEYSYFDFVGTYKPVPIYKRDDGNTYTDAGGNDIHTGTPVIDYQYVPGPFLKLLVEAIKHPEREYCLIIEELNRANAAAVFGDMFQLLDRGDDYASEYGITPQPDVANYLLSQGLTSTAHSLRLPANYTLAATMNNADQGVTYLDAAFKRRWLIKYKPIDLSRNPALAQTLIRYAGSDYRLIDILNLINTRLSDVYSRPEDRLIGPFNITEQALRADRERKNALDRDDRRNEPFEKVLMYLYDDVLRSFRGDGDAFAGSVKSLNDLLKLYPTTNALNLDLSGIKSYMMSSSDTDTLVATSATTNDDMSSDGDLEQ